MLDRAEFARWSEASRNAERGAQLAVKGLLHGLGAGGWALRRLSRHYIPPRYPDAHPAGPPGAYYGPEDSRQALEDLALARSVVDEVWSRTLAAADGGEHGR
jgi:HEPN domain-containing protein